jgi:hypothetical protein
MDANRQAYLAGVRHELLTRRSQAAELLVLGRALDEDCSRTAIQQCLEEADRLLERMESGRTQAWTDDTAAMTSLCTEVAARVGHLGAQVHNPPTTQR